MNDNLPSYEGPGHAYCAALLNDLMLVLSNASQQGIERFDDGGDPVYDFGFWAAQCAMALAVDRNFVKTYAVDARGGTKFLT